MNSHNARKLTNVMIYRTRYRTTKHLSHNALQSPRRLGLKWVIILVSCLLLGCNSAPPDSQTADVERLLVGSWLREYELDGAHVRRLLVLDADGLFSETARVINADGAVTEHKHAGKWIFDGTNLKRHYSSFNGKQPRAPTLPYATLALRFESNRAFVGIDHLRKREVRYQRVNPDLAL